MKKVLTIVLCILAVGAMSVSTAAPRKAIKKKTPVTKKVKPAKPAYHAPALDFEDVMRDNLGRGYNQQLLRNLFANSEFVERAGLEEFKPKVESMSGDVTRHEVHGREILMLRFSNMYDPADEQIVLYDPSRDEFTRGVVFQGGDRQKGGYYRIIDGEGGKSDIDDEVLHRLYDATFE